MWKTLAMTTPVHHTLDTYTFESIPPHNRQPVYTSVTGETKE